MNKSLRPCKQPGCIALVKEGYCEVHKPAIDIENKINNVRSLRMLDNKKTDREKKFYTSGPWIKTSILYRKKHPLCERCSDRGFYRKAEMVHHKIELRELWRNGKNPLSWRYLQSLCNNCHMEDLRRKINKNKNNQHKY